MAVTRLTGSIVVGLTLLVVGIGHASGSAPKCAAAKQKAAGKDASSLLACYAKASQTQLPVDSGCTMKAEGKFTTAFAKADAAGGCILTGDAPNVEPVVDAFASNIVTLTPATMGTTTPKCPGAKQKAAGKTANSLLACYAKATLKQGSVDLACVFKAQDKFPVALDKADRAGGCATTGDFFAIEPVVNAFVAAVVGMTPATTTTTSTTVTTTSTSSTSTTTSTLPTGPFCCATHISLTDECEMESDVNQCTGAGGSIVPGVCRNDGTCGSPTGPGDCCGAPSGGVLFTALSGVPCFVMAGGYTNLYCGPYAGGTYSSSATCTVNGCQ
jgi:hypothetical protein